MRSSTRFRSAELYARVVREGESALEPVGYLMGALAWGSVFAALLVTVVGAWVAVRWRRRTIEALERAELEAAPPSPAGTPLNQQRIQASAPWVRT